MPFVNKLYWQGDECTEMPTAVNVGDVVHFKSDVEQCGYIKGWRRSPYANEFVLLLEREGGFYGDYIGGQTTTEELAKNCWIE